ncbi:MAG TPA: HepT-like ribonuclease domain-containing protein [Candidatus Thermoplasmatota archaeon]|nr:HepT-like ribonuclease domain-containing protein [Candidatus Thermoplasmatota archaeon]
MPWKRIIGMRNRLIHGYFDIDLAIVWKTATEDIPPLIEEIKNMISSCS